MNKLLKSILKGILYVLSFPFIISGIVLFAIVALFIFFFQFGKFIYLFFTGRTLFSDLEEDIQAKQILGQLPKDEPEKEIENSYSIYPTEATLYNGDLNNSLNQPQNNLTENEQINSESKQYSRQDLDQPLSSEILEDSDNE